MRIFSQTKKATIVSYTVNGGEYTSDGFDWFSSRETSAVMISELSRVLGLDPVRLSGCYAAWYRERTVPAGYSPADERSILEVFEFSEWVRRSIARDGKDDATSFVVVNNFNEDRTFSWVHHVC